MDADKPREHQVGSAFIIIDLNENAASSAGYREVIWRVRRAGVVSVYRSWLSDASIPGLDAYGTAAYLLTQAHRRSLLFTYRDSPAARK